MPERITAERVPAQPGKQPAADEVPAGARLLSVSEMLRAGNGAFRRWLDEQSTARGDSSTAAPIADGSAAPRAADKAADGSAALRAAEEAVVAQAMEMLDEPRKAKRAEAEGHIRAEAPLIVRDCVAQGMDNVRQVAYVLATAFHESRFGTREYERSESRVEDHNPYRRQDDGTYGANLHNSSRTKVGADTEAELDAEYWDGMYGGRNGNRAGTTDASDFRGRGYVQLTFRNNYEKMSRRLNELGFSYTHDGKTFGGRGNPPIDLVANFTHVNEVPEVASKILVVGSAEGAFTGRDLGDFIPDELPRSADTPEERDAAMLAQWKGARRVINGQDRAADIAVVAKGFHDALAPLWPRVVPPAQ
ncbi:hypothetical protein Val02_62310 [Virgisporangium aliadipatigenens]|uniref:Uncharacterized protein n=1 Tax=Virgisporangium aliadipatigenens TaxID=741659 RepID=A0A8J4DSK9_9ACTN|nr:hypothetical protein [Virgisporangium aliadipatigenens]GIJ49345.1 hypothetical protein Val02_62310 [Virgisporangium aliadipatigenens]